LPLKDGTRLGPYEILAPIGAGGMGEVYRARDTRLGRDVAVKMVVQGDDRQLLARLKREAQVLASLNHPRICQIFDLGERRGKPFIVMELLDGEPLSARIARGRMEPREAIAIALEVLDALEVLHGRGVVHRDLKPSNIFLTAHGAKLLDFGLARPAPAPDSRDPALTHTGMLLGTPRYMAPEQWSDPAAGPAADLFSMGAILFEMLSGRPAFLGASAVDIFDAQRRGEIPALAGGPESAWIESILRRAMARRPEDRYPSASSMADALRASSLPSAVSGAPEIRAVTRLIVLPFRIPRPDPGVDFLGPALADAVAATLGGIAGLVVRSSRATPLLGADADVKRIASEAAVDVVLMGTLLRAGDRVRVMTQLVEVPSGTLLCAGTAEARLDDLFELQDDLTRQVVDAFRLQLTPKEQRRLQENAPSNPQAYELYLRGTAASSSSMTTSSLFAARDILRKCVELDPGYAPAWAILGRMHRVIAKFGHAEPVENQRLARQAFERALALGPDIPLVHKLYTHFEIEELGSPGPAMLRLLGRVEAGWNDPEIFAGLVAACRYGGLLEASLAAHERARRLDPQIRTSVHFTYFLMGDYRRALEADDEPSQFIRRYALASLGRTAEAAAELEKWIAATDSGHERWIAETLQAAIRKDPAGCVAASKDLRTSGFHDSEGIYYLARALSYAGAAEPALDLLEEVVRGGFTCPTAMLKDPWLEAVRPTARFGAILRDAEEASRHAAELFARAHGPRLLGLPEIRTMVLPGGGSRA
jgi:TolB-like protein/tetratricopeptide (TPR) repeat protein